MVYTLDEKQLKEKFKNKDVKVAIVGFGYIGCCIGAVLASRGIKTVGIDISQELVDSINKGVCVVNEPKLPEMIKKTVSEGTLSASTDYSEIKDCDVIVVTVGTPLADDYSPLMDHITSASENLGKNLQKGQVVMLKSTVPPFTTDDVVKPILEKESSLKAGKDFGLAFSPERIAEGNAIKEFETIPIIVGGIDDKSASIAADFWSTILGVETIVVSNPRAAELTKLADNLWIDLNIALANELALICDKIDADAMEVIHAANSLPKVKGTVNILMPSMGVGGYCLTKDPWFVHNFGKKYDLDLKTPVVSRTVNDYMPKYTFERIKETLKEQGKDIKDSKVAVLGISFKSMTGDVRYTPTKHTIKYLKESGCELEIFDPWVNEKETAEVTDLKQAASIEEATKDADLVAFFTGHPEFMDYDKLKSILKPGCSIIDGRNVFDPAKMKKLGFNYKGIGR